MAGSFFKRGAEGRAASEKHEAAVKAKIELKKNTPWELKMNRGESLKLLFLDSPETLFYVKRHSIKVRNSYEKITCIEDMGIGECPGCTVGTPSYCVACTVITLGEQSDKNGNKYIYQKRLLVVSGDSKAHLEKLIDKRKSLKYCIVEVSRGTGEKSQVVGAYDFEGKISREGFERLKENIVKAKINGDTPISEYLSPYDYEKAFAPLPLADLRKMFGLTETPNSYGAGQDDFSSNDFLDDSPTNDEVSPFAEDTIKTEDSSEYPTDITDDISDLEDDITSEYTNLDEKAMLALMIGRGCVPKAAKKMTTAERIAWLESNTDNASEDDDDNCENSKAYEDMSEKELSGLLEDKGLSKKKILQMDKEDMVEAIKAFDEE